MLFHRDKRMKELRLNGNDKNQCTESRLEGCACSGSLTSQTPWLMQVFDDLWWLHFCALRRITWAAKRNKNTVLDRRWKSVDFVIEMWLSMEIEREHAASTSSNFLRNGFVSKLETNQLPSLVPTSSLAKFFSAHRNSVIGFCGNWVFADEHIDIVHVHYATIETNCFRITTKTHLIEIDFFLNFIWSVGIVLRLLSISNRFIRFYQIGKMSLLSSAHRYSLRQRKCWLYCVTHQSSMRMMKMSSSHVW